MGSNEALYVHPRATELSTKSETCVPDTNFWMVRYIEISDANNYMRLIVNKPLNYDGMYHRHERPLLLYLTIPYSYLSDHSLTVG